MRISTILITTVTAGAALVLSSGPATAGEVTGNGGSTKGPAHANSICVYSGLEDGDDDDDGIPESPNGPGVAPQNWGHVQQFLRNEIGLTVQQIKASGEQPGDSCNGHTGFLSGP